MEKEHGGTTCSSSGCGAASNTRRYICGPTKALARRGTGSAVTSTSIIAAVLIRALTATHRIKPTSTRCQSAWRLNLGRCSTYRRGDSVQTAGTSSIVRFVKEGSRLHTDEASNFKLLKERHGYDHEMVDHSAKEYVRGYVHTNSI